MFTGKSQIPEVLNNGTAEMTSSEKVFQIPSEIQNRECNTLLFDLSSTFPETSTFANLRNLRAQKLELRGLHSGLIISKYISWFMKE